MTDKDIGHLHDRMQALEIHFDYAVKQIKALWGVNTTLGLVIAVGVIKMAFFG